MADELKEVVYTKATVGRRMMAHIIDIGIFFVLTVSLFTLFHTTMKNSSYYKSKDAQLQAMRDESYLFEGSTVITTYVENNKDIETYEQKKKILADRIEKFYHSETYFKGLTKFYDAYQKRQLDAKYQGTNLFVLDSENHIVENGLAAQRYYVFYTNEIDNYGIGYMLANSNYKSLMRFSFWATIVEAIIAITITYSVFYYVIPATFFKLGRQTIGMKLEKIALISVRADNVSFAAFTGRTIFNFFIFVPINFVGLLIPSLVSTTMMYVNKTNSSLTNYVFNDYMVDITNQDIYFSDAEREYAQEQLSQASIENSDFKLK